MAGSGAATWGTWWGTRARSVELGVNEMVSTEAPLLSAVSRTSRAALSWHAACSVVVPTQGQAGLVARITVLRTLNKRNP